MRQRKPGVSDTGHEGAVNAWCPNRDFEFMSTTTSPPKRAVKAAKKAMGPCRYRIRDKALECPICGHDRFTLAAYGAYVGLLGMHTLVCAECSHVEFFVKMPTTMD
jgi:hypothetical protein